MGYRDYCRKMIEQCLPHAKLCYETDETVLTDEHLCKLVTPTLRAISTCFLRLLPNATQLTNHRTLCLFSSSSSHSQHRSTRPPQHPPAPLIAAMATQGLPMGYGSTNSLALDVEGLMRVLSCGTGPSQPGRSHTILVYFARGNARGGDEEKLNKLNVPT